MKSFFLIAIIHVVFFQRSGANVPCTAVSNCASDSPTEPCLSRANDGTIVCVCPVSTFLYDGNCINRFMLEARQYTVFSIGCGRSSEPFYLGGESVCICKPGFFFKNEVCNPIVAISSGNEVTGNQPFVVAAAVGEQIAPMPMPSTDNSPESVLAAVPQPIPVATEFEERPMPVEVVAPVAEVTGEVEETPVPVEVEERPMPVEVEERPMPVEVEETPVPVEVVAPVAETSNEVEETPVPVEVVAPVAETTNEVEETPVPVEVVAPVAKVTNKVEETPVPVEVVAPVAEVTVEVKETPVPVEVVAPVAKVTNEVEETPVPVEVVAPVAEVTVEVEETPAPVSAVVETVHKRQCHHWPVLSDGILDDTLAFFTGDFIHFECPEGKKLYGPKRSRCMEDGQFEEVTPLCLPEKFDSLVGLGSTRPFISMDNN